MTDVPVDDPDTLRRILANTEALLLDFDGPICSVFAGFPAHVVADQLRDVLADSGYCDLPDEVAKSEDPFDVLKHAANLGDDEARYIEASFRAHEIEAITTAAPTPGAHELMRAWNASGCPLAIVSNNSNSAIEAYLNIHNLQHQVAYVSARSTSNVALLKPAPYLVSQASTALKIAPNECALIGDSATDIEAARAVDVWAIGYANKPGKAASLATSGAHAVTTSMAMIATMVSLCA